MSSLEAWVGPPAERDARACDGRRRVWEPAPADALLLGLLVALWMIPGCAGPAPVDHPLPSIADAPPTERLPIDGLYRARGGELLVQLERGRMYLQAGFAPEEAHGTLLYAEIHQTDASHYRCRAPRLEPEGAEILWEPCAIRVGAKGGLDVAIAGPTRESPAPRHFERVALADPKWFSAQAESSEVVSAADAHRTTLEVALVPTAPVPALPPARPPTDVAYVAPGADARFGRYHALVIGSGDYRYLPTVASAEEDADAVSALLSAEYGFTVTDLRNPDLRTLVGAIDRYQTILGPRDNLLIYWAGHGFQSAERGRCYWFPVDATGEDPAEGISDEEIASAVMKMRAKHVLIVADSCFGAAERREVGLDEPDGDAHLRLAKLRARVALTSGGLEPVQDGQGSRHSVFTGAFLAALKRNRSVLDGTTLFSEIQLIVTADASHTPEYANITEAQHEGGDFLFIPGAGRESR